MTIQSRSDVARATAALVLFAIPLVACTTGDVAQVDSGVLDAAAADAAPHDAGSDASVLRWFTTCGDTICRPSDSGIPNQAPACTTERAGDLCANADTECDPGSGCGVLLRCATSDPKIGQGGCPVSTRALKDGIRYLEDRDLERIAMTVEKIRLATYSYKTDPSKREHLGFIIEDDPASLAVADGKTAVDLYGYTSMVVAAMQVQSQKLEKQDAELDALRRKIEALEKASEMRGKR